MCDLTKTVGPASPSFHSPSPPPSKLDGEGAVAHCLPRLPGGPQQWGPSLFLQTPAGHQPAPEARPLHPARWPYCVIHILENLLGLLEVTDFLYALPLQAAWPDLL